MAGAVIRQSRQADIPQGLILTDAAAKTLGNLEALPVEILLMVFRILHQTDLKGISLLNRAIRGIVVAGTTWGSEIQTFRVFNSALSKARVNYSPGVNYRFDWSTQRCIFENSDGAQKNFLAEAPIPVPCAKGWSFPLNDHSLVWVGEDQQTCGRLDVDQENFSVSYSPLPSFLSNIPDMSNILNSIPHPHEIYGFHLMRKGADLHVTLRIKGQGLSDYSEHVLAYEINPEEPSSCYVGKLKDYCRTEGIGILISRVQKISLENGLHIAQQIDKPRERPRETHWEVIGFTGNWLIVHTFISQNRPSQPDKNSRYHLLNKCTLIEEGCIVKSNLSLTNHTDLQLLYLKGNIGIFDDFQNRIICIDEKPIRLTPEGQVTLRAFAEIDDFSYCYKDDRSLEIKMAGKTAKGEKVFVESSAHPYVSMASLSSFPPDHFPQMEAVLQASPFSPYSNGAALAVIPAFPIAPAPVLQRNSVLAKWTLLIAAFLGIIILIRKVLNSIFNKMNRF